MSRSILACALIVSLAIGGRRALAAAPGVRRWVRTSDRLHYAVHLLGGRLFSLCSGTQHRARSQYRRGLYHARSRRQVELLTTATPRSVADRLRELPELLDGGLAWALACARSSGRRHTG